MNISEKTTEELIELRKEISNELVKRTRPNRFAAFEHLDQFFKENGFTQIEGKDEKYLTNGTISIFNCPHFCGNVGFYNGEIKHTNRITGVLTGGYAGQDMGDTTEFITQVKEKFKDLVNVE